MIAQVAELFVQRAVDSPTAEPAAGSVVAARRVLAVDATSGAERLTALLRELERSAPLRIGVVGAEQLCAVPALDVFDAVWLFVDDSADRGYVTLLAGELGERFGVRVTTVCDRATAHADDAAPGWLALDGAVADGGVPWRRRRVRASAVRKLLQTLAGRDPQDAVPVP